VGAPSSSYCSFHPEQNGEKMKTFKSICATLLLAFSLSIPAFAEDAPGDGHTPGRSQLADPPNPVVLRDLGTTTESSGISSDISAQMLSDILLVMGLLS
jgi:hypothetical protein